MPERRGPATVRTMAVAQRSPVTTVVSLGASARELLKVVVDPMSTMLTSLVEMFEPLSGRVPAALVREAWQLARPVPMAPVMRLTADPLGAGVPDCIALLTSEEDLDVPTALDKLRHTSTPNEAGEPTTAPKGRSFMIVSRGW